MATRKMKMDNMSLDQMGPISEDTFDYKSGLGGDTGRGELPNLPAEVNVETNYKSMMQPVSQQLPPEAIDRYGSKMLGLPASAPAIHQLSQLANQYSPDNQMVNSDSGRQVGASLLRRQMNESKDKSWMTEPSFNDYLSSLGMPAGRHDQWDAELKRIYGI